jgi:hypothetical protein
MPRFNIKSGSYVPKKKTTTDEAVTNEAGEAEEAVTNEAVEAIQTSAIQTRSRDIADGTPCSAVTATPALVTDGRSKNWIEMNVIE